MSAPKGHSASPALGPLPLLLTPRAVAVALLTIFIAAGTVVGWCWICLGRPPDYFAAFAARPLEVLGDALAASLRWGALTRAFAWTGMVILMWMMTAPLRGLLARWAILRRHRREEIEYAGALDFVRDWLRGLVWSWPVIALSGWLVAALVAGLGLFGRFPFPWGIGDFIVAVLFPFALFGALIAALIWGGSIAAAPLLLPALAVEGTDLFDADMRALSFVYARPWTYVWGEAQALFQSSIPLALVWFGRRWTAEQGIVPLDHPGWLAALALMLAFGLLLLNRANLSLYLRLRESVDGTSPEAWNAELPSPRRPRPKSTTADAVAVAPPVPDARREGTRRFQATVRIGTPDRDPMQPIEARVFTETWRDLWLAFRISLDLTKLTLVFLAVGTSAVMLGAMMLHFQQGYRTGDFSDILDLGPKAASAIIVAALRGVQADPLTTWAVLGGGVLAIAATWGLVGGVVARVSMVEIAWDRRLPTRVGIRFAAERWVSFTIAAIPGALGGILFFTGFGLLPIALGLPQGREFAAGEIPQTVALLMPLVGVIAIIVSLQASAAIAAERCGGIGALVRAIRYLVMQLPELVAYQCCAIAHGALCSLYVVGFAVAAAGIALFAVAGGMGAGGERLIGYLLTGPEPIEGSAILRAADVMVTAWVSAFLGLAAAFPFAYACVSQSVQYLLCRKALDREPMSAVIPDGLPGVIGNPAAAPGGAAMFERFTRRN